MTIQEIIKKFHPEVTIKDGQKALQINPNIWGKPSTAEISFIKGNREQIILEIERQEDERKAAMAAKQKAEEEERERLISSGEAKLAIVYSGSYLLDVHIMYVVKISGEEKQRYAEWCRDSMHYAVKTVFSSKKIRDAEKALGLELQNDGQIPCESVVHYISQDQYNSIKNWIDNENSRIETEKAAKERAAEENLKSIFEKAKTTGEKQVISSYMAECNDPHEECNTDYVTVWAMPDGSRKTTRQHTW